MPGQIQHFNLPITIPMDGASLRKLKDGRITIGIKTFIIWVEVVTFGLLLVGLSVSTLGAIRGGDLEDVHAGLPWLLGLAGIMVFLTSLLRRSSIEIDVFSMVIKLRRGRKIRQIPASTIAHIAISDRSASRRQEFQIAAILDAGERILMGSVSGFKGDRTLDRARAIAAIIAQATRAPVVDPTRTTVSPRGEFVGSEASVPSVIGGVGDQRSLTARPFLWFGIGVLVFLLLLLGFMVFIFMPGL